MKINKKFIVFIAILLVIIIPAYKVQAAKLKCNEIPVDFCPAPGIDAENNSCTVGYEGTEKVCIIRENPKTCGNIYDEKGTCPEVDDYGNTCKMGYPNGSSEYTCYIEKKSVYKELKTCEEYEDYKTCPTGRKDYKGNLCAADSSGQCYTSVDNTPCSEITSQRLCDNKADKCRWVILDMSKSYCADLVQPTESSPACNTIKDVKTCSTRADCGYIYGNCFNRSDYIKIVNGNEIDIEEVKFVCSDVKYLTGAWLLIRIAAPFIIILLGSLDFFKSVIAGDEKEMKKSRGKFIKRLIAFVLLIILPFIVQFIFSTMGTYGSDNVCLLKCIATNDTSSKGCD